MLADFFYCRIKVCLDRAFIDAINNIRSHPVLYSFTNLTATNYHRHFGSFSKRFQCSVNGRIVRTNDHDFLKCVKMWVLVIVRHFWKILARHIQQVRNIIKSCSNDEVVSDIDVFVSNHSISFLFSVLSGTFHINDFLKQMNIDMMRDCYAAIIFQCFGTNRLCIIGYKRNSTDFESL